MTAANSSGFHLISSETHSIACAWGANVTLPCYLSPEISAVAMEIRWSKNTDCVCLYKNGEMAKGWGYGDRVSLFPEELEKGNVSLEIRNFTQSDLGEYLCQVTSEERTEEIIVRIEARDNYIFRDGNKYLRCLVFLQINRSWNEMERMNMEKSALMAELQLKHLQVETLRNELQQINSKLQEQMMLLEEKEAKLTEQEQMLQRMGVNEERTAEAERREGEETLERRESDGGQISCLRWFCCCCFNQHYEPLQ